jgi:type IV fimbrial biogenesis protein FimT
MITLGIIAIALSAALPGFNSMIRNNNLATQLNSVVSDIYLARNEAVMRNVRVIICRTANPSSSSPSCGGATQTYTSGYLVFADDGNYTNNVYDQGTDTLLRRGQAANSDVIMKTNLTWNINLEFNPDGTTNEGGATARMALCDSRGKAQGRLIEVSPTGIPRMYSTPINTCTP